MATAVLATRAHACAMSCSNVVAVADPLACAVVRRRRRHGLRRRSIPVALANADALNCTTAMAGANLM